MVSCLLADAVFEIKHEVKKYANSAAVLLLTLVCLSTSLKNEIVYKHILVRRRQAVQDGSAVQLDPHRICFAIGEQMP